MKTTSARAIFSATAGLAALFAIPSQGFAQSQEQLANSVRCQVPFVTARAPDVAALQQCAEQMRAKGQVTGIEVHSAPMASSSPEARRDALYRASAVAARLALEFPSSVVNTLAPSSSTSASSASTSATDSSQAGSSDSSMRYGMVDVVGYVTAPGQQAAVEPAPAPAPVNVLVPTVPQFDPAPRRVNPNPGEDFGIGRLESTVDPDEEREVVDDFKYRDGFLNGPVNPDYGITVNLDDAPV